MKILIITGGSQGIGLALANQYYNNNYTVFSLSRTLVNDLPFNQLKIDLIQDDLASTFNSIFNEINISKIKRITLINNAGQLGKIANLETVDTNNISETITLNIAIPLQLSSLFLAKTKALNCTKTILNISSGASKTPYQGWSVYCASKAAINMMTKVIALESTTFKVLAIKPGIVDTKMQEQIRKTDKNDFVSLDKFVNLYKNNQLASPKAVAQKIFKIDTESQFNSGEIIDLHKI